MHSGLMYVLYIIIKTKMDAVNKKKSLKRKVINRQRQTQKVYTFKTLRGILYRKYKEESLLNKS